MCYSVPLRELYPGRSLLMDCWEGKDSFRSLVPGHFLDPESIRIQADRVRQTTYQRSTLAAVLKEQNKGFLAGSRTFSNIEKLSDPLSLVVIGGQQAGLFGGPLYTLHKALTVLAIADHISAFLNRPVVPMFWIASEDHDLAEVNHTYVTDSDGKLVEISLGGDSGSRVPVSKVRLGPGVADAIAAAAAIMPDTDPASEAIAALAAAYSPETSYPHAFGTWMQHVLSDRGVVMLDQADDRLKRIALPLFSREITEKGVVSRAVLRHTARLTQNGYTPQIELREGMLTLFFQDPSREAIVVEDGGFTVKTTGRRLSREELLETLEESPGKLSPNAALRPLFQDFLLPTAAVVLGPSELAYYCQLTEAYREMGIPMPVLFPRASLTLVEPKIEKLLDRHDLSLGEILKHKDRIIDELVKREIPPSLFENLSRGKTEVEKIWRGLIDEVGHFDSTLEPTAKNASGFSGKRFALLEKKIIRAARRKNETLRAQAEKLVSSLYPFQGLQERTLSSLPFLLRCGKPAIEAAFLRIDPFASEHRMVRLSR
jgi:bacillithiol biosynthesis cysteine-adding enzyme BshC